MKKPFADSFFTITNKNFEREALALFRHQYVYNPLYHRFVKHLGRDPENIKSADDIPFLPVTFFKTSRIVTLAEKIKAGTRQKVFESSTTAAQKPGKHYVTDLSVYDRVIREIFIRNFPGKKYAVLALLPGYLERPNASLVYMVNALIRNAGTPRSGFFSREYASLLTAIEEAEKYKEKIFLIGVTHALLDFSEKHRRLLPLGSILVETGGMKGMRKEWVREELHALLSSRFGVPQVHSEYGMTEMLSHAYTGKQGRFVPPPWMKVRIADADDPLSLLPAGTAGRIQVTDLSNKNSCAFLSTDDLGRVFRDGSFEVLGRIDNSELRGCNLML